MLANRLEYVLSALVGLTTLIGCGAKLPATVAVHGKVTVAGAAPDGGEVRFVPIDGNSGPVGVADVVDGGYSISARGGVPAGRHRIEIEPLRKSGRKVAGKPPFSEGSIDELLPFGSRQYGTSNSPLTIDTAELTNGEFNIEVPAS